MTQYKNARLGLWILCAGVLALGGFNFASRGVAGEKGEKIGKVQQGLVGGKEVDEKTQEAYGLLKFSMGDGTCSASLLRNDWAISAAHCVDAKDANDNPMRDPNRPGQNILRPINKYKLKAAWGGGQTKKAIRVETFWPYDVSLIQLDSPFSVNGKTTGYAREVFFDQFPYFGTPTTVTIKVFGAGINQFAFGTGNSAMPSQSDGKFRMGTARVSREEGALYWYPSEGGQMIAGGDSGGPSFATVGTNRTTVLVGVHALTHSEYVPGKPTDGWDWVTRTPEAADAPIRPVWKQIEKIMGPLPKTPDPDNPTPVFQYTTPIGNVNSSSDFNVLYGVQQDGALMWQRHLISRNGNTFKHSWNTPKKVGDGWLAGYKGTYPAGQNAIYSLSDNGELRWHWHTGVLDGSYRWREPSQAVGTGWDAFRYIIPMDHGVVYTILNDGTLRWQQHHDYQNGKISGAQAWMASRMVGWGWDNFKNIFSGGNGVLYVVNQQNQLMWYKLKSYLKPPSVPPSDASHARQLEWERSWEGPKKVGDGWDFVQLFSPGEGHIYGVLANGDLMYYRHLGWQNGSYTWDENAKGKIASGWNAYARVFARIDTSDAGSGNPEVDFVQPK
jgi:hypothetical protein